jgi:aminomethyltransferase
VLSHVGPVLAELGEPVREFRIPAGTAKAYTVKTGEHVQIIDVEGKECSDFMAFDAHDVGQELDNLATRTVLAARFPAPGEAYYSNRGEALVVVAEDQVGRHDTYNSACNRLYYEALGAPGHRNCTDNFNAELGPYGVKPRLFWGSVNFFFNTEVKEDGRRIDAKEPVSQAGDYLLLEAQRDLICASSACPDDISRANGGHPTDIHVRIFRPINPPPAEATAEDPPRGAAS